MYITSCVGESAKIPSNKNFWTELEGKNEGKDIRKVKEGKRVIERQGKEREDREHGSLLSHNCLEEKQ